MTTTPDQIARTFFDAYAAALLGRDEQATADLYAVPALIVFPGNSLAVSDREQNVQFFASAWAQYDSVTEAVAAIDVLAATEHSLWADVTWHYHGAPAEHFVYQLVLDGQVWRIAVLTPLEHPVTADRALGADRRPAPDAPAP